MSSPAPTSDLKRPRVSRPGFALALALACAALGGTACTPEAEPVPYRTVAVERRDLVVSVQAAGVIEPDVTVEVKSKASGEILELPVETGEYVTKDTLLVRIDQRQPKNRLAEARAELDVARARAAIAQQQRDRAERLYKAKSIAETALETAVLEAANARAEVVRAQVAVENAQIQMDDTNVRAPIDGVVIQRGVERGQVISSPTQDVSGGTVLMQMANLESVQVRTLVDETDIGKLRAGLDAEVTVAAFPNRTFRGSVEKIEPQAVTEQSVTMFPVRVSIENREGLLRPGMNAEVEIQVARRDDVLTVPNGALREPGDTAAAAEILGLDPKAVRAELDALRKNAAVSAPPVTEVAARFTLPNGREIELPPGVDSAEAKRIFEKRLAGETLSGDDRKVMRAIRGAMRGGATEGAGARDGEARDTYVVFAERGGRTLALPVRVGLTDLDVSEVLDGLEETDRVYILPSTGLIRSQQQFQERINRVTGGGLPGMRR